MAAMRIVLITIQNKIYIIKKTSLLLLACALSIGFSSYTHAEDTTPTAPEENTYELHIKDHVFTPDALIVPAGEEITLVVYNDDATPEEFESDDLRREKVIAGRSKAIIQLKALEAGTYDFVGEFNSDTANGTITAE